DKADGRLQVEHFLHNSGMKTCVTTGRQDNVGHGRLRRCGIKNKLIIGEFAQSDFSPPSEMMVARQRSNIWLLKNQTLRKSAFRRPNWPDNADIYAALLQRFRDLGRKQFMKCKLHVRVELPVTADDIGEADKHRGSDEADRQPSCLSAVDPPGVGDRRF